MAYPFDVAGNSAFGSRRRLSFRRRRIDWRVVALTACSAVGLIAMLGHSI